MLPADTKASLTSASYIGAHKKQIYALSWNCTGDKLASGSTDTTVRVWRYNNTTGKLSEKHEVEFKGHSEAVNSIACHPDQADTLVSASDRAVRFWDSKSGKSIATVQNVSQSQCLAWSPSGKEVAVGTRDGHLSFIDTRKYRATRTTKWPDEVNGLAWHRNGKILFFGTSAGTFEVVQYPSLEVLWQLQAHSTSCYSLAVASNNKFALTGGADALVALWSLDEMVCVGTSIRPELPVRAVGFSADCQFAAYAAADSIVDIVDAATGEVVSRVQGMVRDGKDDVRLAVDVLAWNPRRPVLAFAGDDKDRGEKDRPPSYGRESALREHQGIIGVCVPAARR